MDKVTSELLHFNYFFHYYCKICINDYSSVYLVYDGIIIFFLDFNKQFLKELFIFHLRKLIELSQESIALGKANNFEVKGYKFIAKPETLRQPRIVRVMYFC